VTRDIFNLQFSICDLRLGEDGKSKIKVQSAKLRIKIQKGLRTDTDLLTVGLDKVKGE
jgi:hypothetical protein